MPPLYDPLDVIWRFGCKTGVIYGSLYLFPHWGLTGPAIQKASADDISESVYRVEMVDMIVYLSLLQVVISTSIVAPRTITKW